MSIDTWRLPDHRKLEEPHLVFHPTRMEDRHRHPLQGLLQFGPYSQSLVNSVFDPIRVALVAPSGGIKVPLGLLDELERHLAPKERTSYLVDFPGISKVLRVRAVPADSGCRIELASSLDALLSSSPRPHLALAEQLGRALQTLAARRMDFDVVMVYLPERWGNSYYGEDEEDFDLHDYVKAACANLGIPVQIVLEHKALSYPCRCSVAWRMSLALYCKAGGVPWKLADTEDDLAFVGLSYAVRTSTHSGPRFVTCCSQVFDSDGAGLEFILYETADAHIERDNPYLSRGEMRRVMARSMALYQKRHGGRAPRHVVVHKSTPFKNEEVDGCFDAWSSIESLELVHVQQNTLWRGIKLQAGRDDNSKAVATPYPLDRGTLLQLGPRDALLWTQGDASSISQGRSFFKEGKAIPTPLALRRFAGHGPWDAHCSAILGLTKMNWNNDSLYDKLPVTLGYASVLARTVKRMSHLASRPYELRFFM